MWDPREDSYIQELAARIEALDQLHQAVVDFSQQFSLDPLIDRVEALEAAQQPAPATEESSATAPPAPAGGLVDGICRDLPLSPGEVRAVIREVVAWLRSEPWLGRAAADRLEQEAER
jgi:hypothetical protein